MIQTNTGIILGMIKGKIYQKTKAPFGTKSEEPSNDMSNIFQMKLHVIKRCIQLIVYRNCRKQEIIYGKVGIKVLSLSLSGVLQSEIFRLGVVKECECRVWRKQDKTLKT